MKDLTKEILSLISEETPAMQMRALKKYLIKAEDNENKVDELEKELASKEEALKTVQHSLDQKQRSYNRLEKEFSEYKAKNEELDTREKNVIKRENRQEISDVKLEEANNRCNLIHDLFRGFLRNTEIRKEIIENSPIVTRNSFGPDNYQESIMRESSNKTITETQE